MDCKSIIKSRRSIRKFKQEPVPEALLGEILDGARFAPSWGNTQAWKVYVVSGPVLEQLKQANRTSLLNGVMPAPEVETPQEWPEIFKKRYVTVGKQVLEALAIRREDRDGRLSYTADMFSFFDAPVFLLICVDRSLPVGYAMLDTGVVVQTLCLLAEERGLGTCILASAISYPTVLRSLLPVPETETIVIGVALGYPEQEAPVNRFARERASLDDLVTWVR